MHIGSQRFAECLISPMLKTFLVNSSGRSPLPKSCNAEVSRFGAGMIVSTCCRLYILYLAAWESTWYPGRTEQHADYLVITSLHLRVNLYACEKQQTYPKPALAEENAEREQLRSLRCWLPSRARSRTTRNESEGGVKLSAYTAFTNQFECIQCRRHLQ